jgi:molecular chaperone DnaK (HSP70)
MELLLTLLWWGIDRQIPTILSYIDGDEYSGQQAKNFLVRNPSNTIAYFRDFLGKEYDSA